MNEKNSFLNLLVHEVPFQYKLKRYKTAKKPVDHIAYEVDDCHKFRNIVYIQETKKEQDKKKLFPQEEPCNENFEREAIQPIDVISWEDKIIYDTEEVKQCDPIENVEIKEYVSRLLESNWEENIMYDKPSIKGMTLFVDDPNLIFEPNETNDKKSKMKKKIPKVGNLDKPIKNKYNISNDKYYDTEAKTKTSLVSFGVQHSIPALKLNSQFYRINHTKEELRNFHRPPFTMSNKKYTFSLPRQDTSAEISIIRKPYEITCSDNTEIMVFEYSEEHPFFVVNPGMVSLLNKYYRKIDSQDDTTLKDTIILEPDEEGPFMGYGAVSSGGTINTIDNNLFVAPVFMHKSLCDYLCINTENKLIYKRINKVCLVGQELPKEEVYAPHSRKLNQFCKDRLKVAAYRVYNKREDLTIEYLDEVMPYFSEGSKRKWLKEYSDCIKRGKDTVYAPKDNCLMMNEEDLRKLVTPENICQYESMLAGERRMEDLGYKILDEEEDGSEFIPSWILSRNFVNATNGKGLLELRGPSDPTGIGEGISFAKIKFKKSSESENRRMLSEHQANYKSEISNIWNAQFESLSKKADSKFRHNLDSQSLSKKVPLKSIVKQNSSKSPEKSKSSLSQKEAKQESVDEGNCLAIKRTFLENGKEVVKTEKIYDQKVIKAYLIAKKKGKSDEKKSTLTCSNCGQPGHMKTNKNCPKYTGSAKKASEKSAKMIMQDKLSKLVSKLTAIPFSAAFHRPVSSKKFPTYYSIIRKPMDFTHIRNSIKTNSYTTFDQFLSHLALIYENCQTFNGTDHSLTEVAKEIYDKGYMYKIDNFDEIIDLESKIEKESELEN